MRGNLTYGPKMLALNDPRWRVFVELFCARGKKNAAKCWTDAGYTDNPDSAKVQACRALQDPRIQDAIQEFTRGRMTELAPMIPDILEEVATDPQAPAAARVQAVKAAAEMGAMPFVKEHRHVHEIDLERMLAVARGLNDPIMLAEAERRLALRVPDRMIDVTPKVPTPDELAQEEY